MQRVAEGHVAVAHTEGNVHHVLSLLGQLDGHLVGTVVDMALLDVTHLVALPDLTSGHLLHLHVGSIVAYVGHHAEW